MNEILKKRIETKAAVIGINFRDAIVSHGSERNVAEAVGALTQEAANIMASWLLEYLWISVDEALPDDDENVLLTFDDGHIIVAYHSGNNWWWCDGFVCGTKTNGQPMYSSSQRVEVDDKPTHWAPIPELKGGEK